MRVKAPTTLFTKDQLQERKLRSFKTVSEFLLTGMNFWIFGEIHLKAKDMIIKGGNQEELESSKDAEQRRKMDS